MTKVLRVYPATKEAIQLLKIQWKLKTEADVMVRLLKERGTLDGR